MMPWLPISKSHDSGLDHLDSPEEGSIVHLSDDEPTSKTSSLHDKPLFNNVHPKQLPKSSVGFEAPCTPPSTRHRYQSDPPKADLVAVQITSTQGDQPPLKLATESTHSLEGSTINQIGVSSPIYDDLESATSGTPPSELSKEPVYQQIPHNKVQTEVVGSPDSPQSEECYDDVIDLAKKFHKDGTNKETELLHTIHHGPTSQHKEVMTERAIKRDKVYEEIDKIQAPAFEPGTEYHEITAVKNVLGHGGEQMTVGRVNQGKSLDTAHTKQTESVNISEIDDIMLSRQITPSVDVGSTSNSPPIARKRTRLPTTKESPKPKPRRSTTGQQKDEQTSPSSDRRKIIVTENSRQGNTSKIANVETSSQSEADSKHVQLSPDQSTNRKAYVNIELRTRSNKKPAPPPPPKRTTPYTGSPTNQRKIQPPVAPKPQKKTHPSI